jgi:hypothetical protein
VIKKETPLFQNNEVIALLIATGVLVFLLANRKRYTIIFSDRFLIVSFVFYFASYVFTVAEGLALFESFSDKLNFMEHLSNTIRSGLVMLWIWVVFARKEKV